MTTTRDVMYARALNASTGGFSGSVRTGNEFHSAGLGRAAEALPYGHTVQGGKLYVGTSWGLRETTPERLAAGKLCSELLAARRSAGPDEDVMNLDRAMRDLTGDAALMVLVDAIRVRRGLSE